MKLTLYVNPNNFTEYLQGEKTMFYAALIQKEGYSIPIVVNKDKYIFESAAVGASIPVFRVYKVVHTSTGPR